MGFPVESSVAEILNFSGAFAKVLFLGEILGTKLCLDQILRFS